MLPATLCLQRLPTLPPPLAADMAHQAQMRKQALPLLFGVDGAIGGKVETTGRDRLLLLRLLGLQTHFHSCCHADSSDVDDHRTRLA